MHPHLHLGAHSFSTYVVLHEIGIALGAVLGWMELRRLGISAARAGATLLILTMFAHLGAHAYHLLTSPSTYLDPRESALDFLTSGLSLHGGILGAYLGLVLVARWLRVSRWALGDALAPSGALALGVFRTGCWARGCCYGRTLPADSWLAGLSTRLVKNHMVSLYPTQLFCAAFAFALFAFLWWRRRRKAFEGELAVIGLLCYPAWRFAIELWRADTPKSHHWLGVDLSANQLMALALLALGIAFVAERRPAS